MTELFVEKDSRIIYEIERVPKEHRVYVRQATPELKDVISRMDYETFERNFEPYEGDPFPILVELYADDLKPVQSI